MVSKKNKKNLSKEGDHFKKSFPKSQTSEKGFDPQRIHPLLAFGILAGLATLLYFNSFQVPWQFDDRPNIVDNPSVHLYNLSPDRFLKLFTFSFSESIRLFSYFSFALNFYLGRLNVFGYHLVNLIIHVTTGISLYWFILLTFNLPSQRERYESIGFKVAFLTSLLFVAHPVQTQAVTYIVQRMTSMAAMFYLLSMILFIKGRLSTGKRRILYYGGMGLSGLLSILSKENAFMLPVFIVLYEVLFFRQWGRGFSYRPMKIFLILGGLGLIGSVLLGERYIDVIREGYQYRDFTMSERVLTQFRVIFHYLTLLVFPHPSRLNLDYDFPVSRSLFDPPTTLFSLIGIVFLVGVGIWKMKKWPVLSFFILWYFGNLVIESSIVPLEMVFEHRLYLPSIGPFLLFSLLFVRLWERWVKTEKPKKEAIFVGALFLAILPLSWATIERNSVWRSEYGLWRDVVEKSPRKGRPHYNLGYFYFFASGQVAKAQEEFELALKLDPKLAPAHLNLGVIYYNQERFDEAFLLFQKALAVYPKYAQARVYLGEIYERKGEVEKGLAEFEQALKIDPYNIRALNHMGLVYMKNGDPERALNEFKKVLMINPDHVEAHVNLAEAYLRKGEADQAFLEVRKATALNPDHGDANTILGMIYLHRGRLDEGISAFRHALQINPNDVAALTNLGVAYRYKGMVDEAISQFKKVLSMKPDDEEAHTNLGEAYLAKGNVNEAMIESEKALQINSRSVAARLNLGTAYFKQGKYDQAISEWKKVLEINPKEAKAHHNLAAAYYVKREFRLALRHFDEASSLGFKVNPQLSEWLKPYR